MKSYQQEGYRFSGAAKRRLQLLYDCTASLAGCARLCKAVEEGVFSHINIVRALLSHHSLSDYLSQYSTLAN